MMLIIIIIRIIITIIITIIIIILLLLDLVLVLPTLCITQEASSAYQKQKMDLSACEGSNLSIKFQYDTNKNQKKIINVFYCLYRNVNREIEEGHLPEKEDNFSDEN